MPEFNEQITQVFDQFDQILDQVDDNDQFETLNDYLNREDQGFE